MASVKKFDHGKITMDLPYFNYLYELPLYSFRDTIGSLSVSLIFNYSLSEEGSTIIFRPGYKLNLQKKLFIDNNEPYAYEDGFGKTRMLVTCDDISLYLFDDETQRFVYKMVQHTFLNTLIIQRMFSTCREKFSQA